MKTKIIFLIVMLMLVSGCATTTNEKFVMTGRNYPQYRLAIVKPDTVTEFEWNLGWLVKRKFPKPDTCAIESKVYAWLIEGDVYVNKTHAFVVKNNKIYDSTAMGFTGLAITHKEVINYYGSSEIWRRNK